VMLPVDCAHACAGSASIAAAATSSTTPCLFICAPPDGIGTTCIAITGPNDQPHDCEQREMNGDAEQKVWNPLENLHRQCIRVNEKARAPKLPRANPTAWQTIVDLPGWRAPHGTGVREESRTSGRLVSIPRRDRRFHDARPKATRISSRGPCIRCRMQPGLDGPRERGRRVMSRLSGAGSQSARRAVQRGLRKCKGKHRVGRSVFPWFCPAQSGGDRRAEPDWDRSNGQNMAPPITWRGRNDESHPHGRSPVSRPAF
jgi:hypothetical protein